jgi:ATP-dependent Clp protease ATP-binding subunit ClpB
VLTVSEAALDLLAEAGFDPVYGARPLKRAIQQRIENPLAQEILKGRFGPGDGISVVLPMASWPSSAHDALSSA